MQTVVICEMFGWTYEEFHKQPVEFINLIREKMKIDVQRSEKQIKSISKK